MKKMLLLILLLCILPVQAQENSEYETVRDALHALAERTGDRLLVRAAAQLARICTNGGIEQTELALGCRVLREALFSGNDDDAIRHLVRGMMGEEVSAIGRDLNYGIKAMAMSLFSRMSQRARGGGVAFDDRREKGLSMRYARFAGLEESGQAALASPTGAFMSLNYADTRRDSTSLEPGFTYDRLSFIMGVDHWVSDNLLLGMAFTYRDERGAMISDLDQDTFGRDAGALDLTQAGISLYGSWQLGAAWRLDALISGALNRYYQSRLIEFHVLQRDGSFADFDGMAEAAPNGTSEMLHVSLNRDWHRGAWRFNAALHWEYAKTDIDGYSEKSVDPSRLIPFLLDIGQRTITSNIAHLQLGADRAFSLSHGVLVPFVQLDLFHEFALDAEHVPMRFQVDPLGLDHQVVTEEPDRDYATLQLGTNLVMANERQLFFRVSRLLGYENVTETVYTIGGRLQF